MLNGIDHCTPWGREARAPSAGTAGVVAARLDARLDRDDRLACPPSSAPCTRASARGRDGSLSRLQVLVDRLLVARLDQRHVDLGLAGVVAVGEPLQLLGQRAGHPVPEGQLDRSAGSGQGSRRAVRQRVEQRRGRGRGDRRVDGGQGSSPTGKVTPGARVTGGRLGDDDRLLARRDDRAPRTARHRNQHRRRQQRQTLHPLTAPAVSPRTNWRWNSDQHHEDRQGGDHGPAVTRLSLSMSLVFRRSRPIWIVRWACR